MNLDAMFQDVIKRYQDVQLAGDVAGLLHWDHQVNLPKKGVAQRSEQMAFMEGLMHRQLTDPQMVEQIGLLAEAGDSLTEEQRINVREIKREVDRAVKVPVELVERISRHVGQSQSVWVEARQNNDFASFAPYLEKIVALRIEEAQALELSDNPYDAMLDQHEPDATQGKIAALLDDLKTRLVPFYQKLREAKPVDDEEIGKHAYPVHKQRAFGQKVVAALGYDFDGGRQDEAAHPFCSGVKGDVRITTRFFESDPRPSLTGMIHEAGHAMYEQGMPDKHLGTPLGLSVSLGVHESQSRFYENVIGRGLAFWKHFYPEYQKVFPDLLADLPLAVWHRWMNVVRPSLIRVEADEVTYNLHIILRFEVEAALVAGEVKVADLPALWNQKMKELLDLDVPNDADGVLQDIHWSIGALGYFPTYTIGNLYAAQLWEAMRRDRPDVEQHIAAGEFAPVLAWLREKIHTQGKRYPGDELIERATGEAPSAVPFIRYLEEKYSPMYQLK